MINENAVADVVVKPIKTVGSDDRGATYEFQTKKTGDFVLLTRKAGSVSGNTYHEGVNRGTMPKTFIILQGTVELSYRHIESEEVHRALVDIPAIIEVQPYVTHAVKAITDVVMLEANSIADIQEDRIRKMVALETVGAEE